MSFSDSDDDGFSIVVDSSQDQSVIRTGSIRSRDDQEEEEYVNSSQTEEAVGEEDQEMDENVDASEDDDGELNNNGLSMPKRKRKDPAPVWKNCAVRLEGGKGKCNFCSKIFTCTDGSISTLVAHIKSKHSSLDAVKELIGDINKKKEGIELAKKVKRLKQMKTGKQASILSFTGRRGVIDPAKKRKLEEALVEMTVGMDRPFDDVENYYFRKVLFIAEPNFICPSRNRHTKNFDQTAIKVKEELKKDIVRDIMEAGHKTVSITSDHGTSSDVDKTKKNALTLARTTKNF